MLKKMLGFSFILMIFIAVHFVSLDATTTSQEDIELNHALKVASLAHDIQNVCSHAIGRNQSSSNLNTFVYGCFLNKSIEDSQMIVNDFQLCCSLREMKCDEEMDCSNRFCECLDMINIVNEPFSNECISSKLEFCESTTSPWGHNDKHLEDDVGFLRVYKSNVLLGGWGIGFFVVITFISFCGFCFLIFICVSYRCCGSKQEQPEEAPYYYPQEEIYQETGSNGEMVEYSINAPHDPRTMTTQRSQAPEQQQQEKENPPPSQSATTAAAAAAPTQQPSIATTKTKDVTNTVSTIAH